MDIGYQSCRVCLLAWHATEVGGMMACVCVNALLLGVRCTYTHIVLALVLHGCPLMYHAHFTTRGDGEHEACDISVAVAGPLAVASIWTIEREAEVFDMLTSSLPFSSQPWRLSGLGRASPVYANPSD